MHNSTVVIGFKKDLEPATSFLIREKSFESTPISTPGPSCSPESPEEPEMNQDKTYKQRHAESTFYLFAITRKAMKNYLKKVFLCILNNDSLCAVVEK